MHDQLYVFYYFPSNVLDTYLNTRLELFEKYIQVHIHDEMYWNNI